MTPSLNLGGGRTVWLASYPKSGNTWMRAILTALTTHRSLFAVNQLGSGSQPHHVGGSLAAWGFDSRWLSRDEVDRTRDALVRRRSVTGPDAEPAEAQTPIIRKTHEQWRAGSPGAEPFPVDATRAALLVVRDPRAVACSYAPFFGVDLPTAVDQIGQDRGAERLGSPARLQTRQPWGTWSSHTRSWLSDEVPFPVLTVRYEDLQDDAVSALGPILRAVGLDCTDEELTTAVDQARFERLQESERARGFRENSPKTRTFFRSGRVEGWREELSGPLVAAVEADHAEVMDTLGYAFTTTRSERERVSEARESRRRSEAAPWWHLPTDLGLRVERGPIPEELADAKRPRRWIQVTPDQALVRFAGGEGLWVRDGSDVTVSADQDGDPSWLVHGWAVTLASLQRGDLSLHAATVKIGDEVVAVAGHRGAGKSTTTMALRKTGHRLLVDDVTLLQLRDDGAWMRPYSRNVHLLPDAAEALGVEFEELPRLSGGRTKAAFRPEAPPGDPQRIDRIIVLAPSDAATEVTLTEARGSQRLTALLAHTARDGIAPLVLGQQRYFELMTRLAAVVPVSVLRRPRTGWTLDAVVSAIAGSATTRSGAAIR